MNMAQASCRLVMIALLLLVPLALILVSPLVGSRDLPYRDKRGSWRNYG
jgi:hypothetical protein